MAGETPEILAEPDKVLLVTLGGACVEVVTATAAPPSMIFGSIVYFDILDRSGNAEKAYISVMITDLASRCVKNFQSNQMQIRYNAIRRELDRRAISFYGPNTRQKRAQEIKVSEKDIASPLAPASDADVRTYLLHRAYWEGFKLSDDPDRYWLEMATPQDLEYLRVDGAAVARAVWFLSGEGLLQTFRRTVAKPTHKLVTTYESKHRSELHDTAVFPKGTQYESLRDIQQILQLANSSIMVVDNFIDESLLDLLAAVPSYVSIRILSFNIPPSVGVALAAFRHQYLHPIEIRRHDREVHDRAIVIDESRSFSLGASIKDAGSKLWIRQELKDDQAIQKLRREIDGIWSASKSL